MLAARQLGLSEVPAVSLTDLSEAELRVLRLALNRITDDAAWDREALALEFSEILELAPQIDLEVSGFEMGEIDVLLDGSGLEQEDELPPIDASATPVSRVGDLWVLGEHHLLCGDALQAESYAQVLGADKADMMFADPPYNVPVAGHVSGLGAVKHADFVMASGELSSAEFQSFLRTSARPCGEPVDRRCHPLRLHGLATSAGGPCRRGRRLQRAHELVRVEQEQCRDGLALPLKA